MKLYLSLFLLLPLALYSMDKEKKEKQEASSWIDYNWRENPTLQSATKKQLRNLLSDFPGLFLALVEISKKSEIFDQEHSTFSITHIKTNGQLKTLAEKGFLMEAGYKAPRHDFKSYEAYVEPYLRNALKELTLDQTRHPEDVDLLLK